jgi:hypothetical protein
LQQILNASPALDIIRAEARIIHSVILETSRRYIVSSEAEGSGAPSLAAAGLRMGGPREVTSQTGF